MKKSEKMALAGIVTALCTVVNILAGIIPASEYILPAIGGGVVAAFAFKSGYKLGCMAYIASSLLSILLCIDKFPAFMFLTFFGFYPMTKFKIDSCGQIAKFFKIIFKFFIFNISMALNLWINIKLFNVPEESFYLFGIYLPPIVIAVLNIFFIMYENVLNKLNILYNILAKSE